MEEFIDKYAEKFKISLDSFDLDEKDLIAEEQLALAFYNLDESHRRKLIKKIPLGILFRLNEYKNKQKKKN